MQDMVKNVGLSPAINTDHSLFFLNFDNVSNSKRGPSYWKFNNSLCEDVEFCHSINRLAPTRFETYSDIEDKGFCVSSNSKLGNFLNPLAKERPKTNVIISEIWKIK